MNTVSGSMTNWLLISSFCLPSAPGYSGPLQVFGVENGKLVPWGPPIQTQGEFEDFVPGKVSKIGAATSFGTDALKFKVWTGNFFVTVPVLIGFTGAKLGPGMTCFRQTGHGMGESGCEFPVEAERHPSSDDETFVRLFSEPIEDGATPAHAVIRKESKVEFLAASARMIFDNSGNAINLGISEDVWLKVRIDGKVGWIHTQEDFEAVGLPPSG